MSEHRSTHAREVLEAGFTVYESQLDETRVPALARRMRALWSEHGEPALFSQEDMVVTERAHVSPVGLTIAGILEAIPAAADILLEPELIELFAELFGGAFEIELGAGVLSDHTRPFFFWHQHIGGIDGEDFRHVVHPPFERCERVACTTYLSPLDAEHGTMLIWPRAITDPTDPPHEPGRKPWPGAIELTCAPGSIVVLDQATWHAVTPMRVAGQRSFVSFFLRRAGVSTVRCDPTVRPTLASHSRLARFYGGVDGDAP